MTGRTRFDTLDMMRGIGALAVLVFHTGLAIPRGYLAVDLFFVLSGFVLYHAYRSELGTPREVAAVLLRRVVRLYPLMFVGAALGLAVNGGSLWTLLLVPGDGEFLYPANGPLWSLLFELGASVAFALLFRFGRPAWALCWLTGAIGTGWAIASHGTVHLGFAWDTALPAVFRTAFSFSTGVAIGWLYLRRSIRQKVSRAALPLALVPILPMLVPQGEAWADFAAVFLFLPLCVALAAAVSPAGSRIARALGEPSYALYAIHRPFLEFAWRFGLPMLPVLVLTCLSAWAAERFFDRPLRIHLRRVLDARARSPLPLSAPLSGSA